MASACLMQNSQLYLEVCVPVLRDVFGVQESFHAEKSGTCGHMSKYTHLKAELVFILINHVETIVSLQTPIS